MDDCIFYYFPGMFCEAVREVIQCSECCLMQISWKRIKPLLTKQEEIQRVRKCDMEFWRKWESGKDRKCVC